MAERNGNSQVEPEHLLLTLLEQGDGVVPQVLTKINMAVGALIQSIRQEINRFSRISGGNVQIGISPRLRTVLVAAHDEMISFGDEYVSTEHLLIALRVIQQRLQNPLALKLLQGEFKEGQRLLVDIDDWGTYLFSSQSN